MYGINVILIIIIVTFIFILLVKQIWQIITMLSFP